MRVSLRLFRIIRPGFTPNPDRVYAAYKPMLDIMLMGMRSQFAKAASAKTAQAPNPADMFGSMLGTLADVQDCSLSISIHADHLDLRSTVVAKPGTNTAALLSAGRGPTVPLPAAYDGGRRTGSGRFLLVSGRICRATRGIRRDCG